jgi:penicillin-binding protein 1A
MVEDSVLDNRAVMIGGTTGILGEWGPEREDNRYEGAMTARQALTKSKNGATVRVGMEAGVDKVLKLSTAAGVRSQRRPFPATFLGSSEITLAELALAYTTFPNGGWRPRTPYIVDRIEEKNGDVWQNMEDTGAEGNQTGNRLRSAFVSGRCAGKQDRTVGTVNLASKIPAAGKTGTAYDFTDALFAVTTTRSPARFLGFDKPQRFIAAPSAANCATGMGGRNERLDYEISTARAR